MCPSASLSGFIILFHDIVKINILMERFIKYCAKETLQANSYVYVMEQPWRLNLECLKEEKSKASPHRQHYLDEFWGAQPESPGRLQSCLSANYNCGEVTETLLGQSFLLYKQIIFNVSFQQQLVSLCLPSVLSTLGLVTALMVQQLVPSALPL